mmetsp:Transcript_21257/g.66787  ORF Transcript_21257/g.66787 Transcript_21257/m.66787 type:complete len:349 (+) Transcript_21257:414-1460(+)
MRPRGRCLRPNPEPGVQGGAVDRHALDVAAVLGLALHAVPHHTRGAPLQQPAAREQGEGGGRPAPDRAVVAQQAAARGVAQHAGLRGEVLLDGAALLRPVGRDAVQRGADRPAHLVHVPAFYIDADGREHSIKGGENRLQDIVVGGQLQGCAGARPLEEQLLGPPRRFAQPEGRVARRVRHDVRHPLARLGRVARVELGATHRHLGGRRGRVLRSVAGADLGGDDAVVQRDAARMNLVALAQHVRFDRRHVFRREQQPERPVEHLDCARWLVSPHRLESLDVERRSIPTGKAGLGLVHETDVPLLGLQHARRVDFLQLKLHRVRARGCYGSRDLPAQRKGFRHRPALK